MFQKNLFTNKIIVITGGASGLGKSMAIHLAKLGAKVVIGSRNKDRIAKACQEIKKAHDLDLMGCTVNVQKKASVEAFSQSVFKEFGRVDGLINNAAGNFLCLSEDLSENAFRSIVETVLFGSFYCSQIFGKIMIRQKKGAILNIIAPYAFSGSCFVLPSAVAKAGVLALTRSLAVEWGPYGIRVNAIAPGFFPTPGAWQRLVPPGLGIEEMAKKRIPDGRMGKHEELTNLVSFLMAEESSHINGETVTIDGGESLQGSLFNFLATQKSHEELREIFNALKPSKA